MKKEMQMNEKVLTVEEGFELWMENCKRRGLTQNTLDYYHTVANIFMGVVSYKTPLTKIDKSIIDYFVIQLMEKNTKVTSLNTYLRGVRAVVYWWIVEEYVQPFKIQRIKCDEEIKDTFTAEEVKILLKKPNLKKIDFLTLEGFTLCSVFYGLGARASTIANLKISDLDLENNSIIYKKIKSRKQVLIPLGGTLVSVFREFLRYRKGEIDDYVFVNYFGEKLTVDRMNLILKRYYRLCGIDKSGVHIWRHTFSRDYIKSGGNALKLQAQLNHKSLEMTRKYVNLYGDDIRDDLHNPLEQIFVTKTKISMKRGGK